MENMLLRLQFPAVSSQPHSEQFDCSMPPGATWMPCGSSAISAWNHQAGGSMKSVSSASGSFVPSRNQSRLPSPVGIRIEELSTSYTGHTTVMMRNLPNDYTRDMLMDLLVSRHYEGTFDFIYLPIDFASKSGLGYAFINFAAPETAEQFRRDFSGFQEWGIASEKVCEVTWSDVQGFKAHVARFRNSPVMHETVPDEHRPWIFCASQRIPFPPPTKKIRAPRHWHRRK